MWKIIELYKNTGRGESILIYLRGLGTYDFAQFQVIYPAMNRKKESLSPKSLQMKAAIWKL